MSLREHSREVAPPPGVTQLLSRLGRRRRGPQISISRWPRGRRRMLILTAGLTFAAITGAAVAAGFLVYGSARRESPELRRALRTCAAEPSCLEWRVQVSCREHTLLGYPRTRQRTLHSLGRSPQEVHWLVTHFMRDCMVEHVDQPREIPAVRRAALQAGA